MEKTELLTMQEVAKELRLSIHTLRAWVFQGKFPVVRLGGRVLLKRQDVDRLVSDGLQLSETKIGGIKGKTRGRKKAVKSINQEEISLIFNNIMELVSKGTRANEAIVKEVKRGMDLLEAK